MPKLWAKIRAEPVREEIMQHPMQKSVSFRGQCEHAEDVVRVGRWQRMPRPIALEQAPVARRLVLLSLARRGP